LPRLKNIDIESISNINCHKVFFKNSSFRYNAAKLLDEIIFSDKPWAKQIVDIYGIHLFVPDADCEGKIDAVSTEEIAPNHGFRLMDDGVDDEDKPGKCYDIDTVTKLNFCPHTRIPFNQEVMSRIHSYKSRHRFMSEYDNKNE
jgi:hypothetical protein